MGTAPLAPQERVERIPVGAAHPLQSERSLRRVAMLCRQHNAPVRSRKLGLRGVHAVTMTLSHQLVSVTQSRTVSSKAAGGSGGSGVMKEEPQPRYVVT